MGSAGAACVPEVCRPVDGRCSVALRADALAVVGTPEEAGLGEAAAGTPEEAGDGEAAAGSRDTQFGSPSRDKGHSTGRKPPWMMSSRPNRRSLTAAVRREGPGR